MIYTCRFNLSWDDQAIDFCFTTILFLIRSNRYTITSSVFALQFRLPVPYPQRHYILHESICNDSKRKKLILSTCHYHYNWLIASCVYTMNNYVDTCTYILFGFIWHWHRCELQTSEEKKIQTDSYFL